MNLCYFSITYRSYIMKLLNICLILFMGIVPLFSQSTPFSDTVELYYSYASTDVIQQSLEQEWADLDLSGDEAEEKLVTSYYHYNLGLTYLRDEEKRAARNEFQTSFDLALEVLELSQSIEVYRMLSTSGFLLAASKGIGAIISMTEELDLYTEKILELDPIDPLGIVMRGQRLIFAPRIAGGDPELALEILNENLIRLDQLERPIQFETLGALSYCWEKLDDQEKALIYAQWAQQIYPENLDSLNRLEELNS